MWKDPEPDPGGDTQEGTATKSSQEISDLKDQNEQQQLLIAQLKEMLRKEQSNVTQEKVEEYVNTLNKAKAKKNRKKEESGSAERNISSSSSSIDISKKQKLNLLKQQMEENKARLAERGKSQKGIEEMVIQLKAQLNDSQQMIPQHFFTTDPKNLEYSKSTSQEELYNILLTKEKKITDLLYKIQKQEASILDLEENLKEKDSVIDARTKAITLMTESLSKKGKNTLDALDDTKEQMRTMQENFITLETEMKARQVKLLDDLKIKNLEIAELQETNQKLLEEKSKFAEDEKCETDDEKSHTEKYKNEIGDLQKQLNEIVTEKESYLLKISDLEKKLEDTAQDLNRFKNTGISASNLDTESNNEEIIKLRKQLEENNKNMIKVKAQSKSKIKELNKKLDQIKKASDSNALIVQLQNENTKLSEKIAELEEEKGNMQLKMVESSDSLKDSAVVEERKELENKLAKYLEELDEKDKIISLLETEIMSLKDESKSLNEKISSFSHLENVQVSTEMNSIQLEEQLEKAESEIVKLKKEIEELITRKTEMAEQMEELKKEKQEISSKLDNYIQENIDLIDKLEKLSAEKVSSAESIEIVEGLTQQEKLELAAYQKNLDPHMEDEPIKCSEDDHVEPPTELNESVLQLSEYSTELLQKIDMFNMERKEVMTKMETLKEENNQLNLKLKEVENNRDILAETYEQLQTEKEGLQHDNDTLIKEIQKLKDDRNHPQEEFSTDKDFESVPLAKLQELQSEYEKLLAENNALKSTVKEFDMLIHEKHDLEAELKKAKEKILDSETKISSNLEEITNYQSVIAENKNEFINSANLINDLQTNLSLHEKDISDLNLIINDLNAVVNNLQQENSKLGSFEQMQTQVTELKTALNDQIQQAHEYEEEIARNNDIITDLNTKLVEMNKKIIETEHEMEMKDIEYKKLVDDLISKEKIIQDLHHQVEAKDKNIGVMIQEMKEKYLSLQKQLDGNSGSLEAKIMELTNKNKEQMDKMKKIAANLKKKSQAYQELEEKYNREKEKWETEVNEKESIILHSQDKSATILQQLKDLQEEISLKNSKLEESEGKISKFTEVIANLEQNKIEMHNTIIDLKHREQKLTEVSLKQELSTSLHEEFDNIPSNQDSAKEEKIKELELIIETNEADIAHFSERILNLEEHIANLVQEKESLLQKTMELDNQLNVTSRSIEEKSLVEEELGQKLLQVTANDEALMKKLEETIEENKEFTKKNKELEELNLKLKVKLKKAHERVTQLKALQNNMEEMENTNTELKKQLAILEANQKHIQDENIELQKQNRNDYEKIESDYQIQMEELVKCKNELTVECEKLQESLKEMVQREEDLLSEIAEYKQKMEENEASTKEKLEEIADELRVVTFNWNDCVKEIEVLNQEIVRLREELINKIARETVESIVTEAEGRVRSMTTIGSQTETVLIQPEIIPTFHWSDGQQLGPTNNHPGNWIDDPVSNLQPNISISNAAFGGTEPMVVDNSKEELLNKIRALEFLLYNIDKEKEEAFQECTGMVNELTRLVYEKVNQSSNEEGARSKKEIHQPLSDVETQIMSDTDITDASSRKELQNIEYEPTHPLLGEQSHPVIEEVIQPKRAYLTYHPEDTNPGSSIKPEVFGENDDGWGWGPEEAKLEEEHQCQSESAPQVQNLRNEIARLNETVQVLQVERENHLEEIKQLQIKSGKLIKKCKELKLKNDQLLEKQQNKKAEGADFFDLDATIQEELKTQIVQLEKRIKEVTNELEKEKQEKNNILKRVDVLTSANERMLEMKEIQDAEVLRWKRKYQEAEEKREQFQWSSDGFNEGIKPKSSEEKASTTEDSKKVEELQQTIKELSMDNEELQVLLEEQRELRINLEKAKTSGSVKTEEESRQLLILEEKLKHYEQELALKTTEMQTVLSERDSIYTQIKELQAVVKEKEESIRELQENLKNIIEMNNEFEKLLADKEIIIRDLQESEKRVKLEHELTDKIKELERELHELNIHKIQQDHLLHEKESAFNQLVSSFEQVNLLKEELDIQVKQLVNDLEQQRQTYNEIQIENSRNISELQVEVTRQQQNIDELKLELNKNITELQQQRQVNNDLQSDFSNRIDQLNEEINDQKQKYEKLHVEYTEKVEEIAKLSQQLQNQQHEPSSNDTFEWVQEKHQLQSLLAEKEASTIELKSQKEALEKQIEELRHNLKQKQDDYDELFKETENKIAKTVKELEESWIIQVDQRGADVAESWKLHLESVETEFATIQEKLKYEINELEEKCNVLVNENNELRKNVDAEIRNEVDRISALQQQITDCQRYISELNTTIIEKQNENENLIAKLTAMEKEKDLIVNDLKDKESKLSSLSIIVDTTQKQFEEKREVVEEIIKILEKNTTFPISFEKEDILNEFQRQLNLINMKEQEIVKLNQTIETLQKQLLSVQDQENEILNLNQVIQEKEIEITRLKKLVDESQEQLRAVHEKDEELSNMNKLVEGLQQQIEGANEKDTEINRLSDLVQELNEKLSFLQKEKDEEISKLNQVIESYKVYHDSSQQEIDQLRQDQVTANMAIDEYKKKLDEYNTAYMTLHNALEEKNQLVATLNQQLQLTESLKSDNNKDVEKLQEEISQLKNDCAMMQQSLADCQEQMFKVNNELTSKNNNLENVNQQLAYFQQNYEIQEDELNKLRNLLQSKEQEYNYTIENLKRTHLKDLENHYEELLAAKDLDIQTMRSQLEESVQNSKQLWEKVILEENLRQQLENKFKELEEKGVEQSTLLDEEDKQLSEMRDIIEQQVIKIEELKKELFAKSSDYDSLIAEMDIGRKAITQQPTTSTLVEKPPISERSQPQEDDLSEPVSRAELDLALYMLHQRDVRCEELTVELTQLLEERDTLQLRLSNALREKEETRRKLAGSEALPVASTSLSSPSTPQSKSSAVLISDSGTELATDAFEISDVQNLESKLSELKSVGYKKDKTFVDEQEFRRFQQMSIMQQHINEASKLPPEAAAKLVDASYTLSRDVQSPSKVLLNWLWGRSTPKVNDT